MLEVSNVKLALAAGLPGLVADELLLRAARTALDVDDRLIAHVSLLKRSVDARKKSDVHFVATLGVALRDGATEDAALAAAGTRGGAGALAGTNVKRHAAYQPLEVTSREVAFAHSGEARPVVVGAGPAGLFAALYLARAGLRPLLLERGASVDERLAAVAAFEAGGDLDPQTNIQFGEGGAGTFSDGKLSTNIKNPLTHHVLRWFVDAGAPEEILWQAKPHIGTDLLVDVVRCMRRQIQEAGGEVCFCSQLVGVHALAGALEGVDVLDVVSGNIKQLPVRRLVLACGHSARDTFEMLYAAGVHVEQKPFSVGVRIEHTQQQINCAQYGAAAEHPALGAAEYKLAAHLPNGRSVYTFCMCPGGEVVCAASEPESVVVNGMSRFARDGRNANSALLVGVGPEDFGSDHPLAGVELQRSMEQAAFRVAVTAGGPRYAAPAQTVGSFLGKPAHPSAVDVTPTYARGVAWCDLRGCLPPFVADALAQALPHFEQKLHGFADDQAVMTGVETRSSSPVRIVRNEACEARFVGKESRDNCHSDRQESQGAPVMASGLYPCGEGAGYAGGIMSAACDGLRVAQALVTSFPLPKT